MPFQSCAVYTEKQRNKDSVDVEVVLQAFSTSVLIAGNTSISIPSRVPCGFISSTL